MTDCQEINDSGIQEHPGEEEECQQQHQQLQESNAPEATMSGTQEQGVEPSHHARRPMNAFLIFCKRHRSVVRDQYPNLENRSITKILGEWWAILEKHEKACYTDLAREFKEAFFSANPGFKWYKLPAPPLRNSAPRMPPSLTEGNSIPSDHDRYHSLTEMLDTKAENNNHLIKYNYNDHKPSTSTFKSNFEKNGKKSMFTPGKLADETQMGGLNRLMVSESSTKNNQDCRNNASYQTSSTDSSRLNDTSFNSSFNLAKCDTSSPNNKSNADLPNVATAATLSDEERRLQDALTETTRSFEMNFDKSNDSSKSNFHNKNTFQNYDSDEGNVGDTKAQSNGSSDESQDVNEFKTKNIFQEDLDPNSRASERACKGKRYQEFMEQVGLKVKRPRREHSERIVKSNFRNDGGLDLTNWKNNKIQQNTITDSNNENISSAYKYKNDLNDSGQTSNNDFDDNNLDQTENFEGPSSKLYTASDFDLDSKIKALPSLSLDKFLHKKKELKTKRKNITTSKNKDTKRSVVVHSTNDLRKHYSHDNKRDQDSELRMVLEHKMQLFQQRKTEITGSKKRKLRKESINRIDIATSNDNNNLPTKSICTNLIPSTSVNLAIMRATDDSLITNQNAASSSDLFALATLAEVAANTSKID